MTEIVNGLFQHSLKEEIRVAAFAVKFAAQPVRRDDGDALLFTRIAEHELMRRFIKIEIRYGQTQAVESRCRRGDPCHERVEKHLFAHAVERRPWDAYRSFDAAREQKSLFEAERQTFQDVAVHRVDRHDADLPHDVCFASERSGTCGRSANGIRMIVGIGTDLAEVERYRFDETQLAAFARKVYTPEEMRYALRKRHWAERLAGFFAAKEATRKAFGHAIPWNRVGVSHERSGKPILVFLEPYARLPASRNVTRIHLTITHTATTAAAVVVLESD